MSERSIAQILDAHVHVDVDYPYAAPGADPEAWLPHDSYQAVLDEVISHGAVFTGTSRLSGILTRGSETVSIRVHQGDRELVEVVAQALLDHDAAAGTDGSFLGRAVTRQALAGIGPRPFDSAPWWDQYSLVAVRADELSQDGAFGAPLAPVSPEAETLATLLQDRCESPEVWAHAYDYVVNTPDILTVARRLAPESRVRVTRTSATPDVPGVGAS